MSLQPYKTLIVDDEAHCRNALQRSIEQYCPQLHILDSVDSVSQARVSLSQYTPDLIFLDVEMPGEDGFDFVEQLAFPIPIIFTTAYDVYALKALKEQALDYLLKPVEEKELIAAVNKLRQKPETVQRSGIAQKVALPTAQGFVLCCPDEIVRCEADGAYTRVFRTNTPLMVSRNIGYVESLLAAYCFFRVHKSHLINLHHVIEYVRGNGGTALMSDHAQIDISKRKREDFLLALS